MELTTLHRRRPVPTLATAAFTVVLIVTVAFFAGLVPGVAKTLRLFTTLVAVTTLALVVAVLAWVVSFVTDRPDTAE